MSAIRPSSAGANTQQTGLRHRNVPARSACSISVNLWQSSQVKNKGKKSDKKDTSSATLLDDNSKRVKEKSSWRNFASGMRNTAATSSHGSLRAATLGVAEEPGGTMSMKLTCEDTIVYQTADLRKVNSTQIRLADRSLLSQANVLGIHCPTDANISSPAFHEPIYLVFPSFDDLGTWLALLRSCTTPEVYGYHAEDFYRVWRMVHLEILQVNNVGVLRPRPVEDQHDTVGEAEHVQDTDATDMDLYCEIVLNGELSARTTTQKGAGNSAWYQSFDFFDLPRLSSLHITVWREKKFLKPITLGTAIIPIEECQHGDLIDGWFALLKQGKGRDAHFIQIGDIKLKYRVEEEVILPLSQYAGLLKIVDGRNIFDTLTELDQRMRLKELAPHVVSVAIARGRLVEEIKQQADKEVENASNTQNTLFRGSTILTKTVERAAQKLGNDWLEASLGECIRKLCTDQVAIETDPEKNPRGYRDLDHQVKLLTEWCERIWASIWQERHNCPTHLREIFGHIRMLVENKCSDVDKLFRWRIVSAFVFLRFFVPAILRPHVFGLWPGLLPPPVQRSLTLICKVMQNLANLNPNVQKEEYMRHAKEFIQKNIDGMIDYLKVVTSPTEQNIPTQSKSIDAQQSSKLMISELLKRQRSTLSPLRRESIPVLPYLIDAPQQLAMITSMVVRNCRKIDSEALSRGTGPPSVQSFTNLGDFVCQCLEVEERALQLVNKMARRLRIGPNGNGALAGQEGDVADKPTRTGSQAGRATFIRSQSAGSSVSTFTGRRVREPETIVLTTEPSYHEVEAGDESKTRVLDSSKSEQPDQSTFYRARSASAGSESSPTSSTAHLVEGRPRKNRLRLFSKPGRD